MVLPGLVAPELPGMPVPAPLDVPLLPLLMPVLPLLPVPLLPPLAPMPLLLPAPPELSGMLPEEPDMPEAPEVPEAPEPPVAPELSGMLLLPELLPVLLPAPLLLPALPPMLPLLPDAPEPPAERPDIELHAASAQTHATSVICFIMRFLLELKGAAHMHSSNRQP